MAARYDGRLGNVSLIHQVRNAALEATHAQNGSRCRAGCTSVKHPVAFESVWFNWDSNHGYKLMALKPSWYQQWRAVGSTRCGVSRNDCFCQTTSSLQSYQLPVADAGLVTSVDSDYKATWIQPPRPPDYAWLDMSESDCDCNWTLNWSGSSFVGHSHGFYSGDDVETTTFAGSSPRSKGAFFFIAFMVIFIATFIFVFIFDCHLLETCPSWPVWVSN